jgi:recombination protein RecR
MAATRFAEPMSRLIEELRKLPGVGTKSAQRLAFHILRSPSADADALAHAIRELKQHLRLCSICNNITDVDPCTYCTSPTRDQHLVCVLEEPTNIATIEKTRSYNGVYHILHGTLSPIGGVGPEQLRIANLLTRILNPAPEITEIILATSPTTEGEATAGYLAAELHRLSPTLKITRIATGVPAGSDIEYADEITMARAMEGRRDF